jgi:NAD(P)-dependent dehydrogenase (short-subunit alcohol dehydrogenase family)
MNFIDLNKLYDFTGRSVIVTGGTGILGRVIVEALLGCGANVGGGFRHSVESSSSLL